MKTLDIEAITNKVKEWLIRQPEIIGIYVAGSFAEGEFDEYADLDIGVVTEDNEAAFEKIWEKRHKALTSIGEPFWHEEVIEPNTKTVMAFFDKTLCPPIGLEVDLCISQLQYVNEQRPFAVYKIIYDPKKLLKNQLKRGSSEEFIKTKVQKLEKKISHYPNFVYDAVKALERGDLFMYQTMLQELRFMIFLCVIIEGNLILFEPKRVIDYMDEKEVQMILDTYKNFNNESIKNIVKLLNKRLPKLQVKEHPQNKIKEAIKASLIVIS